MNRGIFGFLEPVLTSLFILLSLLLITGFAEAATKTDRHLPRESCAGAVQRLVNFQNALNFDSVLVVRTFFGKKHLRVLEGAWKDGRFSVVGRANSREEAEKVFRELAGTIDGLEFYVREDLTVTMVLPTSEGALEFGIWSSEVSACNLLRQRLLESPDVEILSVSKLSPVSSFGSKMDLRRWVATNFHKFHANLAPETRKLLMDFRTSGYRAIQQPLRSIGPDAWPKELRRQVELLDAAILRGQTDREITVYRAVRSAYFERVWRDEDLTTRPLPGEADEGYWFTHLTKEFAEYWNRVHLRGEGIILKIVVSANSNIIPMEYLADMKPIDDLELLLPRRVSYQIEGRETDEAGNRVLLLRIE